MQAYLPMYDFSKLFPSNKKVEKDAKDKIILDYKRELEFVRRSRNAYKGKLTEKLKPKTI